MANAIGHIVIVDDEPDIRETLNDYLTLKGYRVSTANGGPALRDLAARTSFDLVLLDINMPGEDGLSLARFLREKHDSAIIFLTAAGETVDRIVGLEMGADDYLSKPFDLRELHARIKAVMRRLDSSRQMASQTPTMNQVRFGDCVFDIDQHKLFSADKAEIPITAMEYDLLKVFAQNPGKVLSRDRILDLAHNRDWDPYDRSIDIRIARLRRKIEPDPGKPTLITTVRGAGYMFNPVED
ncbi:MAG: response regulator [Rhodospirillales bacterium]